MNFSQSRVTYTLIPRGVSRALRGWRPYELRVLRNEYEYTPTFCCMVFCVRSIVDSVMRTVRLLSSGQAVDFSMASADVLELLGLYEHIVADAGLEFRRTGEARELDIFLGASEEVARAFAKLGSGAGVLVS